MLVENIYFALIPLVAINVICVFQCFYLRSGTSYDLMVCTVEWAIFQIFFYTTAFVRICCTGSVQYPVKFA